MSAVDDKKFSELALNHPPGRYGFSAPLKLKYRASTRIKAVGNKTSGNSGNVGRRHRRRQRAPR